MTDESGGRLPAPGRDALVGTWAKVARVECAEKYPEQLRFTERGLYFGESEETAASRHHTVWDVGRFEVVGPESIKVSTSYDAEIVYGFNVTADALTFKDPDGCEFSYRRAEPGAAKPGGR